MDAGLKIIGWLLTDPSREFTIRDAAEATGVEAAAMRSFVERNRQSLRPVGREATGKRGGQSTRFVLTETGLKALRARIPETFVKLAPTFELPGHLIAAITRLADVSPSTDAKTRVRIIKLAQRTFGERRLDRTRPAILALSNAYEVLLRIAMRESELHVPPLDHIREDAIDVARELDRIGLSTWGLKLTTRLLASPLTAHQSADPVYPAEVHASDAGTSQNLARGTIMGIAGITEAPASGVELPLEIDLDDLPQFPASAATMDPDDDSASIFENLERAVPRSPLHEHGDFTRAAPPPSSSVHPAELVTGIIKRVKSSGVTLVLLDGRVGFVPSSEIPEGGINDPNDALSPGDVVEAVVVVDDASQLSLSIKQADERRLERMVAVAPTKKRDDLY